MRTEDYFQRAEHAIWYGVLLLATLLCCPQANATVWEYQLLNIGSTKNPDRGFYFRDAQIIYPVGSDILDLRVSPASLFFDFEAAGSDVRLRYDDAAETIRIFGHIAESTVYGPWTAGTVSRVREELEGSWYLDMTYSDNVVGLGDGNAYVSDSDAVNTGTLVKTGGKNIGLTFSLFDKAGPKYSLASILQGVAGPHNGRGFTDGWLMLAAADDQGRVGGTADFAFRTELIGSVPPPPPTEVPEPSTLALFAAACAAGAHKRQRSFSRSR